MNVFLITLPLNDSSGRVVATDSWRTREARDSYLIGASEWILKSKDQVQITSQDSYLSNVAASEKSCNLWSTAFSFFNEKGKSIPNFIDRPNQVCPAVVRDSSMIITAN